MTLLEQAHSDGVMIGSLVVSAGVERLGDETSEIVFRILRGIALATVSLRQRDLADQGFDESEQAAFRSEFMEVYDLIVKGWIERSVYDGELH